MGNHPWGTGYPLHHVLSAGIIKQNLSFFLGGLVLQSFLGSGVPRAPTPAHSLPTPLIHLGGLWTLLFFASERKPQSPKQLHINTEKKKTECEDKLVQVLTHEERSLSTAKSAQVPAHLWFTSKSPISIHTSHRLDNLFAASSRLQGWNIQTSVGRSTEQTGDGSRAKQGNL